MAGRRPRGEHVSSRVPPAGGGGAGQRARFNEQVQAQLEQQAAELRAQAETYLAKRGAGILWPTSDDDTRRVAEHLVHRARLEGKPEITVDVPINGEWVQITGRANGTYAVQNVARAPAEVKRVADEFVDWGSSEPVGQPAGQQYVRGYQVLARAFRDHRSAAVAATLVGVWVVIVTIADNPAVTVIVSALLGLVAGYLTTWPRVQSRRARRAAHAAELAERADRQHQLYMRDPAAYLRRIEKGETP